MCRTGVVGYFQGFRRAPVHTLAGLGEGNVGMGINPREALHPRKPAELPWSSPSPQPVRHKMENLTLGLMTFAPDRQIWVLVSVLPPQSWPAHWARS